MPDAASRNIDAEGELDLLLLGVRVSIRAPLALLERYALVFAGLTRPADGVAADIAVRIEPGPDGLDVRLASDGASSERRFADADRVFGFVYAHLLDQVTRRDRSRLCVHAAALAREGQAIAIAAASGHGKSTLTLALASTGWSFLSDEVAAIDPRSLTVVPFPMPLGCRRGTRDLIAGTEFASHGFREEGISGKHYLLPPRERVASASTLAAVFFVEREPGAGGPRRYRLALDPPLPGVARGLAGIDGVRAAHEAPDGTAVEIEVAPGAWVAPAVEGLLGRQGILVAEVEEIGVGAPDFSAEPTLTPLRTSDGVLGLLRNLRGFGALAELAAATHDGFGGLVASLAVAMRGVRFFRLSPGRLASLVATIDAAAGARGRSA